jgi:hypothetical protein
MLAPIQLQKLLGQLNRQDEEMLHYDDMALLGYNTQSRIRAKKQFLFPKYVGALSPHSFSHPPPFPPPPPAFENTN